MIKLIVEITDEHESKVKMEGSATDAEIALLLAELEVLKFNMIEELQNHRKKFGLKEEKTIN